MSDFSKYGETLGSPKERYDEASDYGERFAGNYGLLPAASFDILQEMKKHTYDEDTTEYDKLKDYLDELLDTSGEENFKNTRWVKEHWNDYFPPKPDPKENVPGENYKRYPSFMKEKVKEKIDTNDNGKIEKNELDNFAKDLDDYLEKNPKGREDVPIGYGR